MNKWLIQLFLYGKHNRQPSRGHFGVFAGTVGLACNVLLFVVKITIGLLAGSIAVIADAVNNLSDAASSIVALLGFKLSQKPADREHPFGHARIEYMAGAFIAIGMVLVGVQLLQSSIRKIIEPTEISFSIVSLLVLVVAIGTKLWMRSFYLYVARQIHSSTLEVAAKDSQNDVVTTAVVLAGAVIQYFFHLNLDGWLGACVAVFIVVSGLVSMKETLSPLLGEAPSQQTVQELYQKVLSYDGVLGLHDMMVHSYGPGQLFATVHIEMDARTDPRISHGIIDNIERDVTEQLGIHLVGHYDPLDPPDAETIAITEEVEKIVHSIDLTLSIHDLRTVKTHDHTNIIFDVAVPFSYKGSTVDLKNWIAAGVRALSDTYYPVIEIDRNYLFKTPEV